MKKGFTLIELMIVVAIIAIIAAIAIPNLLRSRMAANEVAAVAACKAFCTAEDIYRRTDYNKDGVLEYAQALSGVNSLYTGTNAATPGDIALIDASFAAAEGLPGAVTPKAGYCFKVLTGKSAAISFISSGHMTLGYGLNAVPNQWDGVGRNTFQVNTAGTIYQADTGSNSQLAVFDTTQAGTGFNWVVSE